MNPDDDLKAQVDAATEAANMQMLEMSVGSRVLRAATAARVAYSALTADAPIGPVPHELCTPIMQQAFAFAWHEFTR